MKQQFEPYKSDRMIELTAEQARAGRKAIIRSGYAFKVRAERMMSWKFCRATPPLDPREEKR